MMTRYLVTLAFELLYENNPEPENGSWYDDLDEAQAAAIECSYDDSVWAVYEVIDGHLGEMLALAFYCNLFVRD